MIWLECYTKWEKLNGRFMPPADAELLLINPNHVVGIACETHGVSRLYVNLSDHVSSVYMAGHPADVADAIGRRERIGA